MFCHEKKEVKYYRTDSKLIYSLPCSPLILETKGKGSHPCCFQVVVGLFCFLWCPHLMAQIRLYWTPLTHGWDVLGSPLDTLMDLSILIWLKHLKTMHSMPLLMPLSWTESLDHLEHVMGPCWCFWAGSHHPLSPRKDSTSNQNLCQTT